ncbi:MAG: DUF5011 domain-containing protein [bacterium]|nr:DUF5011 domain-containing protein [bacterium]
MKYPQLGLRPYQYPTPVGLIGRVPVKMSTEGGAIAIGDRIAVSSIKGRAMKATESGYSVGIALAAFDGSNSTTTEILQNGAEVKLGSILVYLNLGYSKLDSEIAKGDSGGWIIDQASGKIKTSYSLDMDGKDIVNARKILSASGLWSIDENGKLIVQEIETQKLKVASGVTTKDKTTGELYCIFVDNGAIQTTAGECSSVSPTPLPPPSDTEPPVITILGNNPATIGVGATYSDMGVTVTDNIDQNLGYTASLNGGPAFSQGAGLSLDTSTTTTHTILYSATDQAGNTASSTRIVEVADPL